MPWVRIHDNAMTHPKICQLSDKAFRLWVWGLSYAQLHLTDGLITVEAIPVRLKRAAPDLVTRRLWEPHDVGFKVHDYLDWNESRDAVLAKRAGAKGRVDKWREKHIGEVDVCNAFQRSTIETPLARSGVVLSDRSSEKDRDANFERAGRLREELYPAWYAKFRHGARLRLIANTLEFQDAVTICQTWDDARIEKLARIVLTTDDDWIAKTDRSFRIFALKATWADARLAEIEQSRVAG